MKTLNEFVKRNKAEIDNSMDRICPDGVSKNNNDRKVHVLYDTTLNSRARFEGVAI